MFEYGDELILNSYRIPWLIWIQLLVTLLLLLIILLYYSTSDLSTASPSPTALSYVTSAPINTPNNSKVRENEIKETRTSTNEVVQSTNEVVQRAKKPSARHRAEPSTTNEGSAEHSHHPCHIFGLAKQAFLKCLGIDSTADRHHEKDD